MTMKDTDFKQKWHSDKPTNVSHTFGQVKISTLTLNISGTTWLTEMIFTILEMVFNAILTRNDILLLKFSFPTSLEVWETKLVKMVLSCHTLFLVKK